MGLFLTESEVTAEGNLNRLQELDHEIPGDIGNSIADRKWVFLNGKAPITLLDILRLLFCEFDTKHPVFIARFRRFVIILLAPTLIYAKLYMYKDGMGFDPKHKTTVEFVKVGTPLGFLSLLADSKEAAKTFVPLFGGPRYFLIMYYILGIAFFVIPSSVQQFVKYGLPNCAYTPNVESIMPWPNSPFCFSFSEILTISKVHPQQQT